MDRGVFFHYNSIVDGEAIIRSHAVADVAPTSGYFTNYLGVMIDPRAYPPILNGLVGTVEAIPIPANWHADIAEWAAALHAVDLAGDQFTIVELGCAWGCWLCNCGVAARNSGRQVRLIGVEGDSAFADLARQQMAVNGFTAEQYRIHNGIAGPVAGQALFPVQADGETAFGGTPVFGASEDIIDQAVMTGTHRLLEVFDIASLAVDVPRIDLLHIDIQGGEAAFIESCIEGISTHVAFILVGTHSRQIEGSIFQTLLQAGFVLEIERPALLSLHSGTPVVTVDGVQGWRNQRFPISVRS